ncbi:MAG: DotI/IcmL family type IV secretion protein [Micavibrio aeruginosavorus]|nr:DotI/IcmL family type IV secretion protein [Micavibrio aeruginosavorus]
MRQLILSALVSAAFLSPCAAAIAQEQQPSSPAPAAQPGFMQKASAFFEDFFRRILKEEKSVNPSGTLVAPFADESVKPLPKDQRYLAVTETNKVAIDQPHRSDKELGDWLAQAMPQTLSFDAANFDARMAELTVGFSAEGMEQFKSWIINSGILTTMQGNGLQLNGFVTEQPFLLNQGLVNGRYRWLFEVPVMISFMPRGTVQYNPQESTQSRHLLITLQLGRVENSILEHGVVIESWAVRENTRKN